MDRPEEPRFRRNVLRIASGTILGQAIVLAATPLLTRLFGPEDFGALALFTALQAVVAGVFTLKYEQSVILPRDERRAWELTLLTMGVSTLLSLLLLLALGVAHLVWGWPEHACFLLLPLSAVLGAAYSCGQQWSARASNYRPFARSQVTTALVNVGTGAALGLLAGGLFGSLVIGFVAGLAAGTFHLVAALRALRRDSAAAPLPPPSLAETLAAAREYRRFPFFVLPSTLIATLGTSAQPFLLQALFSLREVGLFAVASRFLLVPASLVGGAVSEAFRAEFVARMQGQRTLTDFFAQTLRRLVLFALPVFALFFVAAPEAFAIAFGESYRASGVYARFLCLGVLAQFVAQPFQYVFVATGHVRLGLAVQTVATALPLLGLVAGGRLGGIDHALMLSSALSFATSVMLVVMAWRCCRALERATFAGPAHA